MVRRRSLHGEPHVAAPYWSAEKQSGNVIVWIVPLIVYSIGGTGG
jgi:hypothetical protein